MPLARASGTREFRWVWQVRAAGSSGGTESEPLHSRTQPGCGALNPPPQHGAGSSSADRQESRKELETCHGPAPLPGASHRHNSSELAAWHLHNVLLLTRECQRFPGIQHELVLSRRLCLPSPFPLLVLLGTSGRASLGTVLFAVRWARCWQQTRKLQFKPAELLPPCPVSSAALEQL